MARLARVAVPGTAHDLTQPGNSIDCVAVTLPSIRTNRSCTSWNPPIGLPNWSRSVAQRSACS